MVRILGGKMQGWVFRFSFADEKACQKKKKEMVSSNGKT